MGLSDHEKIKQELSTFLRSCVLLDEEELQALLLHSKYGWMKKKEMLQQKGEVSASVRFIGQGYVRFYHFNERGDEVTSDFVFAPGMVTAFRSWIQQEPSVVCVQAMEDVEFLEWDHADLQDLYERYPRIERVERKMAEQVFMESERHLKSFLNDPPQKRYSQLLKDTPWFVQRIPLVYLASYLGITPESLSRIRNRIFI